MTWTLTFMQIQKLPTTSEFSNKSLPPLTLTTDISSNMDCKPTSSETQTCQEVSNQQSNSILLEDSEKKSSPIPLNHNLENCQEQSTVMSYLVSLLHALPFMFQVRPPPSEVKEGVIQPLDLQEIMEISWELDNMDLYRMIRIPFLLNPLFIQHHHTSTYAALCTLPISITVNRVHVASAG